MTAPRYRILLTLALAIALTGISPASARSDRTVLTFRGRVVDASGKPIREAWVVSTGSRRMGTLIEPGGAYVLPVRGGTLLEVARQPFQIRIQARHSSWRIALPNGAPELALEMRVFTDAAGATRLQVRSNDPDVAARLANAAVLEEDTGIEILLDFVGEPGVPMAHDAVELTALQEVTLVGSSSPARPTRTPAPGPPANLSLAATTDFAAPLPVEWSEQAPLPDKRPEREPGSPPPADPVDAGEISNEEPGELPDFESLADEDPPIDEKPTLALLDAESLEPDVLARRKVTTAPPSPVFLPLVDVPSLATTPAAATHAAVEKAAPATDEVAAAGPEEEVELQPLPPTSADPEADPTAEDTAVLAAAAPDDAPEKAAAPREQASKPVSTPGPSAAPRAPVRVDPAAIFPPGRPRPRITILTPPSSQLPAAWSPVPVTPPVAAGSKPPAGSSKPAGSPLPPPAPDVAGNAAPAPAPTVVEPQVTVAPVVETPVAPGPQHALESGAPGGNRPQPPGVASQKVESSPVVSARAPAENPPAASPPVAAEKRPAASTVTERKLPPVPTTGPIAEAAVPDHGPAPAANAPSEPSRIATAPASRPSDSAPADGALTAPRSRRQRSRRASRLSIEARTVTVPDSPADDTATPGASDSAPTITPAVPRPLPLPGSAVPPSSMPPTSSCRCRIQGTVEVESERPLQGRTQVTVYLEDDPNVQDTVELFMGSPRAFELKNVPCGSHQLLFRTQSRHRFTLVSTAPRVDCTGGGYRQARVVLQPAQANRIVRP